MVYKYLFFVVALIMVNVLLVKLCVKLMLKCGLAELVIYCTVVTCDKVNVLLVK